MGAFLLFVCLLAPIVLLACAAVRGSRKRRAAAAPASACGKALPLPPGSMGWPYVGETFQLYSSKNPNVVKVESSNHFKLLRPVPSVEVENKENAETHDKIFAETESNEVGAPNFKVKMD